MSETFGFTQVQEYLQALVPPRPAELVEMEAHAESIGFPIIGPAAGHLCYQLTRMIGARRVFEMGSGFGYSTAWFARAVRENGGGVVHHVVWDEALSKQAKEHLGRLGYDDLVEYHVAEAVETLRAMAGPPFDLIFNDIDKEGYPESLAVVEEKLRPGGVLIVDNMIWRGRIFQEENHEATTEGVRELTRRIFADPGWISSLAPVRDGLLIAFKETSPEDRPHAGGGD